jgi:hypothetical protein
MKAIITQRAVRTPRTTGVLTSVRVPPADVGLRVAVILVIMVAVINATATRR